MNIVIILWVTGLLSFGAGATLGWVISSKD